MVNGNVRLRCQQKEADLQHNINITFLILIWLVK